MTSIDSIIRTARDRGAWRPAVCVSKAAATVTGLDIGSVYGDTEVSDSDAASILAIMMVQKGR